MKRLLKISEFLDLQKDGEGCERQTHRPAKRQRQGKSSEDLGSSSTTPSVTSRKRYERFLQIFENEGAKECIWWLPGRRGEAFAIHKERFEIAILRDHLEEQSFSEFLRTLNDWGFEHMKNIPSLSGRILAFKRTAADPMGLSSPCTTEVLRDSFESIRHHQSQEPESSATLLSTQASPVDSLITTMSSVQMQQAHFMVQQEIAQTYYSLLWQELQRQLSVLLLQSQTAGSQLAAAAPSEILDLVSLLHQQQAQQQVMTAQFFRTVIVPPVEQLAVLRELKDLQQQQLSNLTYQIVALVAANMENQNQNPQPDAPTIHRILVKYMIALVLLQLQQQQRNLEFLRQERTAALAMVLSTNVISVDDAALLEPTNAIQMQQLLSEAAMLSLSRAHQLLCEAAILIPDIAPLPETPPIPPASNRGPPPPFSGPGLSQGPHPPPRTTTAR